MLRDLQQMKTKVFSSVEIDIIEDKPKPRPILQAPRRGMAPITPTITLLTDNITSSQEFGGCCKPQKE